ncbi:MAG: hypothetical protein R3Y33_06040 [Clostridia bacterium]
MMCYENGDCMMNAKSFTGVNFCLSPICKNMEKQKQAIAKRISDILKADLLSLNDEAEIVRLKKQYMKLKGGRG